MLKIKFKMEGSTMEIKFDETVSLKEMIDRAEYEGATEIKRILPANRNLTGIKIGRRP